MANKAYSLRRSASTVVALTLVAGIGAWVLYTGTGLNPASQATLQKSDSRFRLVSGETRPWKDSPAAQGILETRDFPLLTAMLQQGAAAGSTGASSREERKTIWMDRAPVRILQDPYAGFVAVAVDTIRDEIVAQDEGRSYIMVYNRLANTPPAAAMTEPKRMIGGNLTNVRNNCGVYVDPQSGDIYSLTHDTIDTMTVFSRAAKGNVPADRELKTPHRTYGIAVDEETSEMFLSIQHPPAVVVYHKMAKENDAPLRILQGDQTQLSDVHGITLDTKNKLLFVANRGAGSSLQEGTSLLNIPIRSESGARKWEPPGTSGGGRSVPGTGKFSLPSITVYPLQASGDTPPLRTIQGPKTQLNWTAHMHVDSEHGELFVADGVANAILVFRTTDSGDVAPIRVIKGPRTGMRQPHGVFVDVKNNEVVVANFGSHSVTIYPRTAKGNAAPIRTIRASPEGTFATLLGGIGAVAYDSKRNQLLAPN